MSCLSEAWLGIAMILALVLDRLIGEPQRFHPLVGFGNAAAALEAKFNKGVAGHSAMITKSLGAVSWALLCIPLPWLLSEFLASSDFAVEQVVSVLVLCFCIAPRSLGEHAIAISNSLYRSDLHLARANLAKIVSRDCKNLDKEKVASGAIESVLENGSDGVIAPLFWFGLLGAPGVLLYRFANTLDAMWGYRNPRFEYFGFAAAKIDDFLNWVPARVCAFLYAISGEFISAIGCWRSQGRQWSSPNAGPVMASGAGALQIRIGGNAIYAGREEKRTTLGIGATPSADDIGRSLGLVNKATGFFVFFILLGELLLCYLSTVVI